MNKLGRLLLQLLVCVAAGEEWYMREARLIDEAGFALAMQGECFKVVKFFLPHCKYCRLLKEVFDELKAEREWHFEAYDMNCAWYPSFCSQQGVPGSFPYVAIYDRKGEKYSEIHGFYPAHVIRSILSNLESDAAVQKGLQQEVTVHPLAYIQEHIV